MKTLHDPQLSVLLAAFLLALIGCSSPHQSWPQAADSVRQQDTGAFPYHPLVYHLDLSILSYQLYGQSLVWPFDPYYEDSDMGSGERDPMMEKVRAWAKVKGAQQARRGAGLEGYRGPGMLGGFADSASHDPILYRYDRLHPWSDTVTKGVTRWTEYLTPKTITRQIRDVYVCYRKTGRSEGTVAIERLPRRQASRAPGARDVLLAFEGGTGDKGEAGQPASQSLMGFVLLRHWAGGNKYDVHITFRGSRSGSAKRAAWLSLSDTNASGNPDWITALGYDLVGPESGGGHISTTGEVSRGFARGMLSIFPQLFRCLRKAAELAPGRRPENIYVTGHSLGGGLGQHFTSAVLMGDRYGPGGKGEAMPASLRNWPWTQVKLVTFGAPRTGDALWAKTLTTEGLDSEFFSTPIDPVDRKALAVTDASVVPRLSDKNRPAGFRVLISKDPITSEKIPGGKHVGKTVYVNKPRLLDLVSLPDESAHEPVNTRDLMLAGLADSRIPATAWRYHEMRELNPERDESQVGSIAEFEKLRSVLERYYREHDQWFDHATFARDFALFRRILSAE